MNKIIPWVIGLVIALGGGGYYYYQRANQPVAAPPPLPAAIEEQPTPRTGTRTLAGPG
jgi:hypothetical protein